MSIDWCVLTLDALPTNVPMVTLLSSNIDPLPLYSRQITDQINQHQYHLNMNELSVSARRILILRLQRLLVREDAEHVTYTKIFYRSICIMASRKGVSRSIH